MDATFPNPLGVSKKVTYNILYHFLLLIVKSNKETPQERSSHWNTIHVSLLLNYALALQQVKL